MTETIKKAYVIGDPIAQSKSPLIHNAAYRALGIEADWFYDHAHITAEQLASFIEAREFDGLSVTMPHKSAIIPLLDLITPKAWATNAVNCVYFEGSSDRGEICGTNTDIDGIIGAFAEAGVKTADEVLILGNGATSRSAQFAANLMGAQRVVFAHRHEGAEVDIRDEAALRLAVQSADVVISTLPWGPAEMVLPPLAAELAETPTLECAFPKVLPTSIDGSRMLIFQAVKQIELMTGRECTQAAIDAMSDAMSNPGTASADAPTTKA